MVDKGFSKANAYLTIKNSRNQLSQSRKEFQIATIKGNIKDKNKYFKKAIEAIDKLREMVGY
jgi:CYTH domain-containing protein